MNRLNLKSGFTIFEALIAISIGVMLLLVVMTVYILAVNATNASQNRAELGQNSRSIIERLTRDIRQTRALATPLPLTKNDPDLAPAGELEIQDGHDTSTLHYIRYYLSGTDLNRQVREYYFPGDPQILVPFNAKDDLDNPALSRVTEDNLVGQNVNSLKFYGRDLLTVELGLAIKNITHATATTLYVKNL